MRVDGRKGVGAGVTVGTGLGVGVGVGVGVAMGTGEGVRVAGTCVAVGSDTQDTRISRRIETTVAMPGDFMAVH